MTLRSAFIRYVCLCLCPSQAYLADRKFNDWAMHYIMISMIIFLYKLACVLRASSFWTIVQISLRNGRAVAALEFTWIVYWFLVVAKFMND